MADNLLKRGRPDRRLINMQEDYEVKYWTKHLDVSREEAVELHSRHGQCLSSSIDSCADSKTRRTRESSARLGEHHRATRAHPRNQRQQIATHKEVD